MAFADDFTFARAGAAGWHDAGGAAHSAAANVPRFSWEDGEAIGLLIQPGAGLGQADQAALRDGIVPVLAKATVLHAWRREGSAGYRAVQYDGHYSEDAEAMINGCLGLTGAHAGITVVSGYLRNWGAPGERGWVWAFGRRWYLPGAIAASGGRVLGTGDGRAVIGL